MRWVTNQSCAAETAELLAMDWCAIGLLIQQQAFDAMALHQRVLFEFCGDKPASELVVERDR